MFTFFSADQQSATVLQQFRDYCDSYNTDAGPPHFHDDKAEWLYETIFMQVYNFEETNNTEKLNTNTLIDNFFTHLMVDTDLHETIRTYFLPEAQRNTYVQSRTSSPWRKVEMPEARNAVATFLTGHVFLQPWDTTRTQPYIVRKDILQLTDAFIELFEPDAEYYVSQTPLNKGVWSSYPVTHADLNACIICIQRTQQRVGLVVAQDWSG